jgi:predicted ester cyclase
MAHYDEAATFQSPSVLALQPTSNGVVSGRDAIRELYALSLERFPDLRFELDEVIERPSGVILIYRKLHVFTDHPGLTVEIFEMAADGLVKRNIVYWGSEEVSSRFRIKEI